MDTGSQQNRAQMAGECPIEKNSARAALPFTGLLAVTFLLAHNELVSWLRLSLHDERFSYLCLIPLISAGLIFETRRTVFQQLTRAWDGLVLVAAGSVLSIIARVLTFREPVDALSVSILGLVVVLLGLFRLSFGQTASRAARFPLAFLLFMVPLPVFLLARITYLLQVGSATVVEGILTLLRAPYVRDGLTFDLTGLSIQIAQQCSGIRSSTALVLLTILSAHFALRSHWRQVVLVVAVVPVVIFKNGLRIATLSLMAIHVDPRFITGAPHHEGGFVFFGLMWLVMIVLCLALRKGDKKALCANTCTASGRGARSAAGVC